MRTLIVHQPVALGHTIEDIKAVVIERNLAILNGQEFPGTTPFLSDRDLIGDPNAFLGDATCEMLFAAGFLSRTPVLDENGKQRKLDAKYTGIEDDFLWDYAWVSPNDGTLVALSEEDLSALAWELRNHPNFVHVSVVNDEPVTSSEEVLDSTESEEYDGSAESDVEGAWANQDAGED